MNIGNVGKGDNVERGGGRNQRTEGRRDGELPRPGATDRAADRAPDRAAISADGRDAAARFDAHVAAAAESDAAERMAVVAQAVKKLSGGDLDTEAVHRAVAERLHGGGFLSI
jgi:hypothetical protein